MANKPCNRRNPKSPGTRHHLTPAQKIRAKATARTAGRPYPNLVDNMNEAKKRREGRSWAKR